MSKEYTRELVLDDLQSKDKNIMCDALVGIAFCEEDWQWAQNKFMEYLENNDPVLKGLAATCLGHIARIHEKT